MKIGSPDFFNAFVLLCLSFIGGFSSCKKEQNISAQGIVEITALKVDSSSNKTAYAGHALHLQAELFVYTLLQNFKVQITPAVSGSGWTFLKGLEEGINWLKNASFHEYLQIPKVTRPGAYNLLMVLFDKRGKEMRLKLFLIS